MTTREALRVLSEPYTLDASAHDLAQYELAKTEAIAVVADALGFAAEAETARLIMQSLIAKDEHQLRLFELLGGTEA